MLHIFDLDDTLVRYGRKKICVPRQTHHALRALRGEKAIISYNNMASVIATLQGLKIANISCGNKDRHILAGEVLSKSIGTEIHYWDDRSDNLLAVCTYYPFIHPHLVTDSLTLWRDLKQINCQN